MSRSGSSIDRTEVNHVVRVVDEKDVADVPFERLITRAGSGKGEAG